MTTKERIEKLVSICKGSVDISFNEHTTNYETLEEHIFRDYFGRFEGMDPELLTAIKEAGVLVVVQAYPRTPVGCVLVMHHDLDKALDEAIEAAENY